MDSLTIKYKSITIEEFEAMSGYDLNYSGVLYIFLEEYTDRIRNKLFVDWNINKKYRFEDHVKYNRMFYIENMDIQTVDSELDLYFLFKNDIKEVHFIGNEYDI